jgi:hypothetical protein
MKKRPPDPEKQWLADQLQILLPKVDDNIHMKAALALNCDYAVVKSYLTGNIRDKGFAELLVDMIGHLVEGADKTPMAAYSHKNIGTILWGISELVQRTLRECKSTKAELVFVEHKINEHFKCLQATLTDIINSTKREVY